jgi:hypothetical protein
MMVLAIWFDELIRRGEVKNFAELARLGYVSRTQVSQVMNLLLLAPAIQEELLFLPCTLTGPDTIHLKGLQNLATLTDWTAQNKCWRETFGVSNGH